MNVRQFTASGLLRRMFTSAGHPSIRGYNKNEQPIQVRFTISEARSVLADLLVKVLIVHFSNPPDDSDRSSAHTIKLTGVRGG